MKNSMLLLSILFSINTFAKFNKKCSLAYSQEPSCYHKRQQKIFNIALIYYGDHWKKTDLDRIEPILIERFYKATGNKLELRVLNKVAISYKTKMPAGYQFNNIKDPARLQRIFYSETVGTKIMKEVYEEYKAQSHKKILNKLDAIVAITGAQFEGLGYADGRVSVTEFPREIAWALPDGGRVEYVSDYQIVDELIHELGHNMFLGHTSTQCQKPEMSFPERKVCCANSPSKNDVLSYCRKRANVDETFMHVFEACNRSMINKLVIPSLISGGPWKVKNRTRCE